MKITHNQEVEFDEFSRACDLVEAYFGDTLDDVALHAPVSRRQLVAVLARAQLSGRQLALDGLVGTKTGPGTGADTDADAETATGEIVYQSNRETLFWLDGDFWTDMRGRHHLEPDEERAAREVHRRILEAIDGDVSHYNRERDPFVLIERFGNYE